VQFKERLTEKIKATYEKAQNDPNYSTFLKHFGEFTVPKLDQKELSPDQFIITRLEELAHSVSRLERQSRRPSSAEPLRILEIPFPPKSSSALRAYMRGYASSRFGDNIKVSVNEEKLQLVFPSSRYTKSAGDEMEEILLSEIAAFDEKYGGLSKKVTATGEEQQKLDRHNKSSSESKRALP